MACFSWYSDFTSQQNVTIIYLTLRKRWRSILRSANCNYPTIWVHLHNCLGLGIGKPTETNNPWQGNNSPTSPPPQKSSPNHMHGRPRCLIPSFLKDRHRGALSFSKDAPSRQREKERKRCRKGISSQCIDRLQSKAVCLILPVMFFFKKNGEKFPHFLKKQYKKISSGRKEEKEKSFLRS